MAVELLTMMIILVCLMAIAMSTGPLATAYLVEWWRSKRTQSPKIKTDHTA